MADTSKLTDMLNNLIDKNSEQAQVDFHDYLQGKMREVIANGANTTQSTEQGEED